jgi:hypothetical protein
LETAAQLWWVKMVKAFEFNFGSLLSQNSIPYCMTGMSGMWVENPVRGMQDTKQKRKPINVDIQFQAAFSVINST